MSRVPASFRLQPIGEEACDGRRKIVFGCHRVHGEHFAIARWRDETWQFASGLPLDFKPESYVP